MTVLVTHGVVVSEATGQSLEEGEAIVFRPLGNSRFRVVGRVMPGEWGTLRRPASTSAVTPHVQEYTVPAGSHPHDVAPAPDGTVWYTAQATGKLGRLDPATGGTTEIPLGEGSAPHGVIVGPDGAAWVTDGGLNAIVRVEPGTTAFRGFRLPPSMGNANLNTATFDKRGILWFTGQNGIYGRLNPKTGAMRVFRAPLGRGPYGITTTPTGRVFYASLAEATSRRSTFAPARRPSSDRRPPARAHAGCGRTRRGGSGSASGTPGRWLATTLPRRSGASGTSPGRLSPTPSTSTTKTSSG